MPIAYPNIKPPSNENAPKGPPTERWYQGKLLEQALRALEGKRLPGFLEYVEREARKAGDHLQLQGIEEYRAMSRTWTPKLPRA